MLKYPGPTPFAASAEESAAIPPLFDNTRPAATTTPMVARINWTASVIVTAKRPSVVYMMKTSVRNDGSVLPVMPSMLKALRAESTMAASIPTNAIREGENPVFSRLSRHISTPGSQARCKRQLSELACSGKG